MSVFLGRRKPGSSWTALDTTAALAWQSYEDSLCPGCGQPRHETMEKGVQYRAHALRCQSCKAIHERAGKYPDADARAGIYFSTERD